MLPLAEVMDKMPPFGDVMTATIALTGLLAVAAGWRPLLGSLIVLVAARFIPWFGPSRWAMNASLEAIVGDAMRNEDPAYFSFARSIPLWFLAGILVGTAIWIAKRRLRVIRESGERAGGESLQG